jgi:pSer/pThr/pTyr-binding forkhead associated (FHA) protein
MSGPIVLALRLILALALYAFLGWALWTIWLDLQRQGLETSGRRTPAIRLQVHAGAGPSRSHDLSQREILVGRDPACQLHLDDETISARHARLRYHHGHWWIEDLGSTNGTRLNGQLLTTPTVLTSGDEIGCGQILLSVELGGDGLVPQD